MNHDKFSVIKGRLYYMEKKKIMFFIYQMGAGGAARTLLNILNHIDKSEFEPILVTLNFNGSYESYLDPTIKFIKLETKRLRSAIIPLAKLIRKERPDILFSTIPVYNTVAILGRLLSFTNTKNIVREAALLKGSFRLRMFGFFYRFASKIISLSEGVKENLIKRYKVKEKNIQVIYNPIDLDKIQQLANDGDISEEHKVIFKKNAKVIITAGRLVKEKDHQTLIKAFDIVNKRINSELFILGEGELENNLKRLAKDLGIEHKVHFIGFQYNPYIYFKNADLFVLSSINEGFGHVLVESLSVGTPVVSTNCKPGAEEVLMNGTFGRIANVGDIEDLASSIYEVLTLSDEDKARIITKGIKRANDFDVKKIVKQYEDVFRQIGEKRRYPKRS